ncbi:hypothetical protein Bbelb_251180 [Branchiostoma belcheri]|nr:hypothetical protein Bbelb_251180 [Branchiostoma belcheri]
MNLGGRAVLPAPKRYRGAYDGVTGYQRPRCCSLGKSTLHGSLLTLLRWKLAPVQQASSRKGPSLGWEIPCLRRATSRNPVKEPKRLIVMSRRASCRCAACL